MRLEDLMVIADEVDSALDEHVERMTEVGDLASMREQCTSHRSAILRTLDAMRSTMLAGGMMDDDEPMMGGRDMM